MISIDWPAARLTPIARARALAAGLPGAGLAEVTIEAPYDEAWPRIMDLERSTPAADPLVSDLEVRSRRLDDDGVEHLDVRSRSLFGWARFDVRIEDGFCLMAERRRLFVVVMAAEPHADDPSRTRYVHVEAISRRLARPLSPVFRRIVAADARGFRAHVERELGPPPEGAP